MANDSLFSEVEAIPHDDIKFIRDRSRGKATGNKIYSKNSYNLPVASTPSAKKLMIFDGLAKGFSKVTKLFINKIDRLVDGKLINIEEKNY